MLRERHTHMFSPSYECATYQKQQKLFWTDNFTPSVFIFRLKVFIAELPKFYGAQVKT